MPDSGSTPKALSKAGSRYWLEAGRLVIDPRSRFYSVRFLERGRRERFPLKTAIKLEASKRAARIFSDVISLGWDAAIAKHKPEYGKAKAVATVGALIEAVSQAAEVRPVAMMVNATAMRRMVADAGR